MNNILGLWIHVQPSQKGEIGVTLVTAWFVPTTLTTASERAARRALDFMFGW